LLRRRNDSDGSYEGPHEKQLPRTGRCLTAPDPLGLRTTSNGNLDEEEILRRKQSITLNLFEIIMERETNETTSKDGKGEAWEKRGISVLPHAETLSVKAFTMPRAGIIYLHNKFMFVNMNIKGTSLKSGVSPINLSNLDDTYLSNRMIDTPSGKAEKWSITY
jgi:hypothetical protein